MISRTMMIGLFLVIVQILTVMETQAIGFRDSPIILRALKIVTMSINQFSRELYEKTVLDGDTSNLIFSPLSVWMVLSLASNGAGGKTKLVLTSTLHTNLSVEIQNFAVEKLMERLNSVKNPELRIVNKVFYSFNLTLNENFEHVSRKIYKSSAQDVDFSDTEKSSRYINDWIKVQTHSRISDIVKSGELSSDTNLVLINAVYFKGLWKNKFNESATNYQPFHLDRQQTKSVPMMRTEGKFKVGYLSDVEAEFIELPYMAKNDKDVVSMIVIVPNKDINLRVIEKRMKTVDISRLLSGQVTEVSLSLPKFKIESKINLEPSLSELGLAHMFDYSANFSGIVDQPVKVSKIVQKAFIEVNEEGSEASAVTGMELENRFGRDFAPHVIKIDRPFVFYIVNKNATIFVGRVCNPTTSEPKKRKFTRG